jgi:ferritin-like metal-binding protein YciE
MINMENLKDLFTETLQDIYYAEQAILKALPKMAKKATDADLKAAFEQHLGETQGQVERLKQVFDVLGEKPKAKKCDAIEGLIKEAEGIMDEAKTPQVMDAGLISSAQAVEHYEIARYGTLRTWAEELGMPKAATLLQATLDEEHACNDTLSEIAMGDVNLAAEDGDEDGDDGKKSAGRTGSKQAASRLSSTSARSASK